MAQTNEGKLAKDVGQLYETSAFSDFSVETNDGQKFRVHRSVLAVRSKGFMAILTMEYSKEVLTGRCEAIDIDGPTMNLLLEFIYGTYRAGSIDSNEKALKVLLAAHKYDVSDLVQPCIQTLQSTLNKDNATDVLLAADQFQLPDLKKSALYHVAKNRPDFLRAGQLERVRNQSVKLMEEVLKEVSNKEEVHTARANCPVSAAREFFVGALMFKFNIRDGLRF